MHALHTRFALLDGVFRPAAVVLDGESIVAILPEPPPGVSVETLPDDAVLLPALVDTHVHINEPGRTEWEGFATATRAAAAGGVTTVVDMPLNSDPVTTTLAALETKIAASEGQLYVDVGLWGGVIPGNTHELAPMVEAGVFGFKCFTCPSGIDDFPHVTEADMRAAMRALKPLGVPLLVHAELELEGTNPYADASPRAYLRYLHARPRAWEDAAIAMTIRLVRETGCRAHIVHLSSASALPMIKSAKAEGLPISVETCPHYLCLAAEDVPDGDTAWKCAPPIREAENREILWRGLAEGVIDFVISDHSPCVPALKLPERGDFLDAWGGIASLQLGLPNVWTAARRRGFALTDVIRWMSGGPAAFLGTDRRIAVGARADLVAFCPERDVTITAEALLHRHKLTPYLGTRVHGSVHGTWMRGARVATDPASDEAPRGRIVRRGGEGRA
ncbi:MAG: allantoinase AllB [Pseudomonadota bacterium]|nr:allantoinase AllB [Pseudomonadota bacterium]